MRRWICSFTFELLHLVDYSHKHAQGGRQSEQSSGNAQAVDGANFLPVAYLSSTISRRIEKFDTQHIALDATDSGGIADEIN